VRKVLIIDDDASIQAMLKRVLSERGFEVITAYGGVEALAVAERELPDIILLDRTMPDKPGEEVLKELRLNVNTKLIPVIFATGRGSMEDVVDGLSVGADDYIAKPFSMDVLCARIESVLRRCAVNLDANPLSRLPGNGVIEREIQRLIDEKKLFAVLYIDINYFKAYNDYYGFHRGDSVLRAMSDLLREIGAANQSMAAHVGGDDFVIITEREDVTAIHAKIMDRFNGLREGFYDPEDRAAGYITVKDRLGVERHFSLLTVAVGVVTNRVRPLRSVGEVSTIAAEVKGVAKRLDTGFFVDRRNFPYGAPQKGQG
jgi:diguanylate cyclase (GGDEF)-like protein